MKSFIKVIAFFYCFDLFAATPNVQLFPTEEEEPRLTAFKQMCEKLAPIVKDHSGRKHTCFITYAWPSSLHAPLNSWIEAIRSFLSIAGIEVYFDKEDFGGLTTNLEEKCKNALKNIVLLTPDLKIKHDEVKTQLVQEIGIVFKKSVDARKLILLSSQVSDCLPDKKYLGGYVNDTELIHMMTPSNFRDQKSTDVPCIDRFFSVMCSLLDPKNSWGLLSNIQSGFEETCHQHIQAFLTNSKMSFSEGVQLNRTIPSITKRLRLTIPKAEQPNKIVSYLPRLTCFLESGLETEAGSYLQRVIDYFHENDTSAKKRLITIHDKRFSVLGMGGIGKTTLALKYAHIAEEKKWYNIVYWIPSETRTNFIQGYRELLGRIDKAINPEGLSEEEVIKLFLERIRSFKTLLILDNVPPSYEERGEHADNYLAPILPTGNNAHILMTSRETNWSCKTLNLSSFSIVEATNYLLEITEFDDEENAKLLAEELGCLPLALSYAAAYMKEKNVSLKNYFDLYKSSLEKVFSFHPRFEAYPHTVASTFEISLNMLDENSIELLSKFSYVDPDKIYVDIFNSHLDKMKESLERLESLSLIKYDRSENTISLHRLLQAVFRKKILPNIKKTINIIKDEFCQFLRPYHLTNEDEYYNGRKDFEEQIDEISVTEKIKILERIDYIDRQSKLLKDYSHNIYNHSYLMFMHYHEELELSSIKKIRNNILQSVLKQHQDMKDCDRLIQESINIEEEKFKEFTCFLNDNNIYILDSAERKIIYQFLKYIEHDSLLKENFKRFREVENRVFSAYELINIFIFCESILADNFSDLISKYQGSILLYPFLKGGHLLWVINTFNNNSLDIAIFLAKLLINHLETFEYIKDYKKIEEKIRTIFLDTDKVIIERYDSIMTEYRSILPHESLFNLHHFIRLLDSFEKIPLDKWTDLLAFYKQERLEIKKCDLLINLTFFEELYPLFDLNEGFLYADLFPKADDFLQIIPTSYDPEDSYFGEYDRYYMGIALSKIDPKMWDKAIQRMKDYIDKGCYGALASLMGYESRTIHEITDFISIAATIDDDKEWNSVFDKSPYFTSGLTGFEMVKLYPIVMNKTVNDLKAIEKFANIIDEYFQKNDYEPDHFFHLNLLELFKNEDENMINNVMKAIGGRKTSIDKVFSEIESILGELKKGLVNFL